MAKALARFMQTHLATNGAAAPGRWQPARSIYWCGDQWSPRVRVMNEMHINEKGVQHNTKYNYRALHAKATIKAERLPTIVTKGGGGRNPPVQWDPDSCCNVATLQSKST